MSRTLLELDEEVQIGLRAASEVAHDPVALETCLQRVVRALDIQEEVIELMSRNRTGVTETSLCAAENDWQWKRALIDALPLDATGDQWRAAYTLVKSRPWLS